MNKRRVVITATQEIPVDTQILQLTLGDNYELEIVPLPFGDMSLAEREAHWRRIAEAEALLVRTGVIPYELIGQCHKLKIIVLHGAGVDQVDVKAATEAGIYVTNVPDGNAQAVAELTFALMLSAKRQILHAHQCVKQGQWGTPGGFGSELSCKRLGLVGAGDVAQRVVRIAQAFDMDVIYWDFAGQSLEPARRVSQEELFKASDVVSIHLELTASTRGLVDRRMLSLIKPDAWLVSTSRSVIINGFDLLQALQEGWFAGAALDISEHDWLPPQSQLLSLPNVIVTPHLGSSSRESLARFAKAAANDISAVFSRQQPRNAFNKPWGCKPS